MSRKESFFSLPNQSDNENLSIKEVNVTPQNFGSSFLEISQKEILSCSDSLIIKSKLADIFLGTYLNYQENNSSAKQLQDDFELIEEKFLRILPLDIDKNVNDSNNLRKRVPSFIEAIKGTLLRFSKMETIRKVFRDRTEGIILGGSMSYGPFFNIRENLDLTSSSDIDLIIIVDDNQFQDDWNFIQGISFLNEADKETLLKRKEIFLNLYKKGEADIFSKKFNIADADFEISIHFFPKEIFENMLGQELINNLRVNQDIVKILRDYKDNHFPHNKCCQKSFSGKAYEFITPIEELVNCGRITLLPSYIIYASEFYPGIYQNLISPCFSDSGNQETNLYINRFKEIMIQRLRQEREFNPKNKFQLSHVRQSYFSPLLNQKLGKY